jgi:hypothetical protein
MPELRVTPVTFMAICPTCRQERRQSGFSVGTARRLLDLRLPIEGYCVDCDQFWHVSEADRGALAQRLSR